MAKRKRTQIPKGLKHLCSGMRWKTVSFCVQQHVDKPAVHISGPNGRALSIAWQDDGSISITPFVDCVPGKGFSGWSFKPIDPHAGIRVAHALDPKLR